MTERQREPWWRGAVIYQVYPRSFRDANGDGVGDLRGCIDGLDYIASLGVDGIWLSPFFTSPMRDFGYDVADYRGVDPVFGTLDDFDELVAKSHRCGLKVIIDQVYSHTSDVHAWFTQSRCSRDNLRADWYVWADPKEDGTPPTNWQSVFGGSAWTWDSRRGQYFLHNFLSSQPDLNLHNPEVQDAVLEVARFWLGRGVDGFRLDALNFSMHDPELRDNPPVDATRRALARRPHDFQQHLRNQSHPDIVQFLERIRGVLEDYDGAFSVAEVGGPEPLGEMKAFTAEGRRLHSAYGFDFLYADAISPVLVRETAAAWPGLPGEGWPSWAFSNHDAPRAISRWCPLDPAVDAGRYAQLMLLLLCSMRGNVFLYQGEELGLPTANVPFEYLQDPEAIANWPATLGRDSARTPMPWRAEAPNAGFTDGAPWLPVDPRHVALAIDQQDQPGANSTLNFTRRLLQLRCDSAPLRWGETHFIDTVADDSLLAFIREYQGERVLCLFNLDPSAAYELPVAPEGWACVLGHGAMGGDAEEMTFNDALPAFLPPVSGLIAKRMG
ncbi:MAG: alpha-glucosidase [Pseudomonadota bacterium]